ncbi:MAG: nuclear transport factor 2 family protein [Microthrixaceae bacterium]
MANPDSVTRLLAHHGIDQLNRTYADAVNRRVFDEFDRFLSPSSVMHFDVADREPVELTGPHAIAEFHKSAMARFGFYVFTALATHVDLGDGSDPSAATGRVWMCEIRRELPGLDWSAAYGLYQDRYEHDGDRWTFAERRYSTLTRTAGPVMDLPPMLAAQIADLSSPESPVQPYDAPQ